jgi:hypothetical protein
MAFQLDWEHEDHTGTNPLGKPGTLWFDIEFEFEPGSAPTFYTANGDGDPGYPPSVTFTNTCCTGVDFFNDEPVPRSPTAKEKAVLDQWFLDELYKNAKLRRHAEEACADLVDFEPDFDDVDD